MLTILNYLNNGEKTNITESMLKQVDKAIRETITDSIVPVVNTDSNKMSTSEFITDYVNMTGGMAALIYYYDEAYTIKQYYPGNRTTIITRGTLIDSRNYLKENGYKVRYLRTEKDNVDLIEAWI